jgi:hypothetical protein
MAFSPEELVGDGLEHGFVEFQLLGAVGGQGLPDAGFVIPEEKVELVQGAYGLGLCDHLGGQGFHMVDD